MSNHFPHITNEHLVFLSLIGTKLARLILRKLGTKRLSLYPIKELLDRQAMAEALKTDKPVKQVAKEIGVHPSTVYRFMKRMRNK